MDVKDFISTNKLGIKEEKIKNLEKKKIGILITNLGTPAKPTYWSLFKYLAQFLGDKRVVKLNRFLWLPILYGFILPFRSGSSAAKYRKIWTPEGSPLNINTQKQCTALTEVLSKKYGDKITISYGMRYGEKSIESGLEDLKKKDINKLLIFPLYPQSAECTTSSTFDCVSKSLKSWINVPSLRFISGYCFHEIYINSLKEKIESYWEKNGKGKKLIISYHGLPTAAVKQGDAYPFYCINSTNKLIEKLQLKKDEYVLGFQSRIEGQRWLQPAIEDIIIKLALEGYEQVDIICPSFTSDCLETLEEIQITYQQLFQKHGKGKLRYIECFNDSQLGTALFTHVIEENLVGWT